MSGETQGASRRTPTEIEAWLRDYVGSMIGEPAAKIGPEEVIESFGIDSCFAVSLLLDLSEWLGLKEDLAPELLFEQRTLRALARHVAA